MISIFCAAVYLFIIQYPGKKVRHTSLVYHMQIMADRRKSTVDRRKSTFDGANEKPESATERGSIWIPLNPTAKHDDPFGKKFKMTRSDNLFVQMGTRFEELTVKRIYIEDSISFLAPYKELQDNRRSIYYGQPKMSTPYPSGP